MATYKTVGLVLGRSNLGEADRIITLFTADYGKLRVVAKGVKKIKSRMAGHVEPFSQVELMLAEGRNLDIITSARLISYPHAVVEDLARLSRAFMMASMLDKLTEERSSQPELFELGQETLEGLQAGIDPPLVELYFKLKLLAALGVKPELDHCVICHADGADLSYRLSVERGGLVDSGCAGPLDAPISQSVIKLWRFIYHHTLNSLTNVTGAAQLAANSLDACDAFYEYQFGRRFRPNMEAIA